MTKKRYINNQIILFLIFVFCFPLVSLILSENILVSQSDITNFILYGFRAATPTLSALLVIVIFGGNMEIENFIKKCYIRNIRMKYIILAIVLPTIILLLTKLTSVILLKDIPLTEGIKKEKFIVIFWVLISEEVGWRGFFQEKIDVYFSNLITPIIIGLIWAMWHYHFFILGTISAPIILFTIGCITESYGYYWLTKKSKGNIIPASLWHFMGNLLLNIFLIYPKYNKGSLLPYLLFTAYLFVMAISITIWGVLSEKKKCI